MVRSLRPLASLAVLAFVLPCAVVACVGDDPTSAPDATAPTASTATPDGASPIDAATPPVDAADAATPDVSVPPVDASDGAVPLHFVFVTSASVTGAFGAGLPAGQTPWTAADDICRTEAMAASLPGKYVAWLSFTNASGTKFNASGRIADWPYSLPGTAGGVPPVLVAANRADLITKGPLVPMDRLASGLRVDQDENMFVTYVWTGSNGDGTASFQDCAGWTSALATQSGVAGNARRIASPTATDWTAFGGRTCDARRRFYCFQVP